MPTATMNLFLILALLSTYTLAIRVRIIPQSLTRTTSRQLKTFDSFASFNKRPSTSFPRTGIEIFGRLCEDNKEIRTFDGHCNNAMHPAWGRAHNTFIRKSTPILVGGVRPNPRVVSNIVCRRTATKPNRRRMSEFTTFFGQFLDHTITETENTETEMPIVIPADDPVFTNGGTIPFFRTKRRGQGALASPLNRLSSYVDASSVYGVNKAEVDALRSKVDGKLRMSAGNLLPTNSRGFFLAGDTRVNENPLLTSIHTLWAREHNVVADEVKAAYPTYSDEQLFQLARKVTIAEMQAVVFHEFLPALMGKKLPPYTGYKTYIQAEVTDEFSTVAFRVGHTLINAHVTSMTKSGVTKRRLLRDSFFNPRAFRDDGMDNLLRAILKNRAAEVDNEVTDEVRDFLITSDATRTTQLDLAALNIQRGRDHAIPAYNTLRSAFGLAPVFSFSAITKDTAVAKKLSDAYGSVSKVDPWVGGISEDHSSGSLGPLFTAIWVDQFTKLRDGDRFYFEKAGLFSADEISKIPSLKSLVGTRADIGKVMRKVLLRNTAITADEFSGSPFFV